MKRILSVFRAEAGRSDQPDVRDLIAAARLEGDPALIDAAMLNASGRAPFWPDGLALETFLRNAKKDAPLDAKLMAAAAFSSQERGEALLTKRQADRAGAFSHFIAPDHDNYFQSRIFKLARAAHTGGGTGAFGGLAEKEDPEIAVTVDREVGEEIFDSLRYLLAAEKATAQEVALDLALSRAGREDKTVAQGLHAFIDGLEDAGLQAKARAFVGRAEDLVKDLLAAPRHNLFVSRDDSHVITRGWGLCIDAHAHITDLPPATGEKFLRFAEEVKGLREKALLQGQRAAGEMEGIETYTFLEAPEKIARCHYGHEALAEMIGFGKLLYPQLGNRGLRHFYDDCLESGAVDMIARKMRLTVEQLQKIYERGCRKIGTDYQRLSAADYAEAAHAAKSDEPDATRKLSPPRGPVGK